MFSSYYPRARNRQHGWTAMDDTGKYLIHAEIVADGIVERSDVVGAIFGQTEGLLGDDLDLRNLQNASKVGRLDVEIDSHEGRSVGEVTIATNLDKVETATVAAALETIERVGPCRATVEVTDIEDSRAAKRRAIIERAQELLFDSFEGSLSSDEIVDEVRRRVQADEITSYQGLPAGPRVEVADAVILVEGRADVLTLLEAGIENAIAVEGTDIPDAIADLSRDRTITAFLDGDRGGELIFRELMQLAELDYVTFAPTGRSVEDLDQSEILATLQDKVPIETIEETGIEDAPLGEATPAASTDGAGVLQVPSETQAETVKETGSGQTPSSLPEHAAAVAGSDTCRLLTDEYSIIEELPAADTFEGIQETEAVPYAVVCDRPLTQRLLDIAAQRGTVHVVGTERGGFTKRPTDIRVRTTDELTTT